MDVINNTNKLKQRKNLLTNIKIESYYPDNF